MNRLDALVADRRPCNGTYFTIAIDGRGASGKSSLARFLETRLHGFSVVHGDDYFEPHNDPITWGQFNEERLETEVLSQIRAGEREIVSRPCDFLRSTLGPARRICVERGLLFDRWFSLELPVQWDIRIWVETPANICLARGIARDADAAAEERVRLAWEQVWQPREARYIEETEPLDKADIVIDGTAPFEPQLDLPGA
ncbi:MAG: hypothetical protein ABI586_09505 [Candidatus Nanopelagicales bacterium]